MEQFLETFKDKGCGEQALSFPVQTTPSSTSNSRQGARLRGEDGICIVCHVDTEDLNHAFFTCPQSRVAGLALLGLVQVLCPNLQPEDVLELRLGEALPDVDELAAVYTIATGLFYIWESRKLKKQITPFLVRAELEAKISLLRRTRYCETGNRMQEMLENSR